MFWERPREFWQTGWDAHIAVGKRVLGGLMEVFGGFVQPVFLPRQKRLQIHGRGFQNCFSYQYTCFAHAYSHKKDKHNSG